MESRIQNNQNQKLTQISELLEASYQPANYQLLCHLGMKDIMAQLEIGLGKLLSAQNALARTSGNLNLARNRRRTRFQLVRKKVNAMRHCLRRHCRHNPQLMRAMGIHPNQTPQNRNPSQHFGYWNNLLSAIHLLRSGAYAGIALSEPEKAYGQDLENAIYFYDGEQVICMALELEWQTNRKTFCQARQQLWRTFLELRARMKKATLNGQPAWPMLQALFFGQYTGRDIVVIVTEVMHHAS